MKHIPLIRTRSVKGGMTYDEGTNYRRWHDYSRLTLGVEVVVTTRR